MASCRRLRSPNNSVPPLPMSSACPYSRPPSSPLPCETVLRGDSQYAPCLNLLSFRRLRSFPNPARAYTTPHGSTSAYHTRKFQEIGLVKPHTLGWTSLTAYGIFDGYQKSMKLYLRVASRPHVLGGQTPRGEAETLIGDPGTDAIRVRSRPRLVRTSMHRNFWRIAICPPPPPLGQIAAPENAQEHLCPTGARFL